MFLSTFRDLYCKITYLKIGKKNHIEACKYSTYSLNHSILFNKKYFTNTKESNNAIIVVILEENMPSSKSLLEEPSSSLKDIRRYRHLFLRHVDFKNPAISFFFSEVWFEKKLSIIRLF